MTKHSTHMMGDPATFGTFNLVPSSSCLSSPAHASYLDQETQRPSAAMGAAEGRRRCMLQIRWPPCGGLGGRHRRNTQRRI